MHSLKQSILKVIAYFDVFDYPVKLEEIAFFLDQPSTNANISFALQQLQDHNIVHRFNNLYSLKNNYALAQRRINGNLLAEKKLRQAERIAQFLMLFPYIKGVAVSGSLSKNFAYEGSDIDFFIITAARRLWIARMFFMFFFWPAKLAGFKNYFCLNYFVDETALEIPEKNLYTAIEIATLLPKQGVKIFGKFFEHNEWLYNYLPNYTPKYYNVKDKKEALIKRFVQWLLDSKMGDRLDNMLHHFYKQRWEKMMLQKRYAKNGFLFGSYIAGKHVCKPIPHYFQEKILKRFEEKMQPLEKMYHALELAAV